MLTITEGIIIVIISSVVGPLLVNYFKDKKTKNTNDELLTRLASIDGQISHLAGLVAVSLDSSKYIGNLAYENAIAIENNGKHNGRHKKAKKEYEDFENNKQEVIKNLLTKKEKKATQ